MATQTVTLDQLGRYFAGLNGDLRRVDFTPAWKIVRVLVLSETLQHFARGVTPDGTPWAPLKRPSKRRGGKSAKPLRDKGLLMASVTGAGAGHVEELTKTAFVFGTNLDYAGFHQFGTRRIPQREFLGLGLKTIDRVAGIVADVATKQLAEKPIQ